MTEITHEEVRDALPELLHGTVDAPRRIAIENHLRDCAECASEMRLLQMVKGAPSFAPAIDAVRVSSLIAPYGGVPAERPRRTKISWQMASVAAALVLVVATVVARRDQTPAPAPTTVATSQTTVAPVMTTASPAPSITVVASKPRPVERTRELQVAVGLEGLSDGSVAQLVKDLDGLDGLPSPEPENLGVGDPSTDSAGGQ